MLYFLCNNILCYFKIVTKQLQYTGCGI